MAFGLCADPKLQSTASWVYNGETLQIFPVNLPTTGVEIAIDASSLTLDASRERIVQDEQFTQMWERAKREFQLFYSALKKAYPGKSRRVLIQQAHFDKEAKWCGFYQETLKEKIRARES